MEEKDIVAGFLMGIAGAGVIVASGFSPSIAVDFQSKSIVSFLSGSPSELLPFLYPLLILSLYYTLYLLSYRLSMPGFALFLLSALPLVPSSGASFFLAFASLSLLFKYISKKSSLPLTMSLILAAYLLSPQLYGSFKSAVSSSVSDELWARVSSVQEEIVRSVAEQLSTSLPESHREEFVNTMVSESMNGLSSQKEMLMSSLLDEIIFTPSFERWFPAISAITMSFLLSVPSLIGEILASLVSLAIPGKTMTEGSREESV